MIKLTTRSTHHRTRTPVHLQSTDLPKRLYDLV